MKERSAHKRPYNAPINSKLQHPPPPPGQTKGIWTFEDWIVQIPAPSGKNGVQMPYPVVGFVCLSPTFEDLFCKPVARKCYISSFKLFQLAQTRVLWLLATWASEKKSFENWLFRFNFRHPTQAKVKFPTPQAQTIVKCLRFAGRGGGGDVEVSIWSAHKFMLPCF